MNTAAQQTMGFDGEVSGMSLTDLLQAQSYGAFQWTNRGGVEMVNQATSFSGTVIWYMLSLSSLREKDAFARILAWGGVVPSGLSRR